MTDRRLEQRWARRDADLAGAWFALLCAGMFYQPLFYVALVLAAGLVVALVVRHLRRRRRWRTQPPGEFWADRFSE
ncbi:MAG TPA: hypothetical protein VF519_17050 [Mycobacteriales bacterium]